jgi:acyl-CoA thioesterase-1
VGDEDEGGAGGGVEVEEHVDDGAAGFVVEVAGGFVGEEDFRAVHEGAGQGDALLLAAGKLVRVVVDAIGKADAGEVLAGLLLRVADAAEFERHEDVFQRGERGEELEALENEPGGGVAQGGEGVFVESVEILSVEEHVAGGGTVEAGAESEQRGLAAARGADDGAVGPGGEVEVDVGKHGQRVPGGGVSFAESAHGEDGREALAFGGGGFRGLLGVHMRGSLYVLLLGAVVAAAAPTGEPGRIVILGDSITAGYNLAPEEAYPALLQEKIKAAGLNYEVINAGQSGDTTAGGLRRIDWVLEEGAPEVMVIALGGNDGLRGLPVAQVGENLAAIAAKARAVNPAVRIVIAGMQMPGSMGADYAESFAAVFGEVAREQDAVLLPFLLEGVAGDPDLNQPDRIHPTAQGQRRIAETVWGTLERLLR